MPADGRYPARNTAAGPGAWRGAPGPSGLPSVFPQAGRYAACRLEFRGDTDRVHGLVLPSQATGVVHPLVSAEWVKILTLAAHHARVRLVMLPQTGAWARGEERKPGAVSATAPPT